MSRLFDEQTGGLVAYWKTVTAITSRVGSGPACRIYADQARQKAVLPFIVYTRGSGGEVFRHLNGSTGARTTILHVYCWGDTRAEADALCEAVKANTENQRGLWGNTFINWVFVDDPQDDGNDPPFDGSEQKRPWSRIVLRIMHAE